MHRHLRSHKSPVSEEQDDDDYVYDSDSSVDSRFSISSSSSAFRRSSRNSISSSASSRRPSASRCSLPPFSSFELRPSPRNSISLSAPSRRLSSSQHSRPPSPSSKHRISASSVAHPDHGGPNAFSTLLARSLAELGSTVSGNVIPNDDGNDNGAQPGLTRVNDRHSGARADGMPCEVWTPMYPSANDQFHVSSSPSPICPPSVDALPPPLDPNLRSSTQPASTSSHEPTAETTAQGLTYDDPFDRKSNFCLDGRIFRLGDHATASGGFADVWEGLLDRRKVAVKVMRPFASTGKRMEQSKLLRVRLWLAKPKF